MHFSDLYDKKYLIQRLLWLVGCIALMRATGGSGFVIILPFVFYSLIARKTENLLFWVLMAISMIIVNGNFVPKNGVFALSQRGLMVAVGGIMSFNVLSQKSHRVMKPFAIMLLYVVFMIWPSLDGWCPPVSLLKLVLFAFIYFAYYGVANQVGVNPNVSSKKIRSVMLAFVILFVFGSACLVPFPQLAQLQAEDYLKAIASGREVSSLFTGMTNHSQCLGPVVSMSAVVLFADLLFSIKKWDPIYVGLLCCCPYLIYTTSSRTGMASFILGLGFVLFIFMRARGIQSRWKSRALTSVFAVFVLGFVALAWTPQFSEKALNFALKTKSATGELTAENVMSSRQGLMDGALENWRKKPLTGNGFQVSSNMVGMRIETLRDMMSAPVEKGVWITAVLEEGGVVGWGIFVFFLCYAIFISVKRRAYVGASCLFLTTLTNMGEFTFFSMSYTGGYIWAMVFVGLAIDISKMSDENRALRNQMMFMQFS